MQKIILLSKIEYDLVLGLTHRSSRDRTHGIYEAGLPSLAVAT